MLRKVILVCVSLLFLSQAAAAYSQAFFVNGGAVLSDAGPYEVIEPVQPLVQLGARIWYTDLFQVQGAISYQGAPSAEASVLFRPMSGRDVFEPFAFLGFGRYFATDTDPRYERRSLLPAGLGGFFHLTDALSLDVQLGVRWALLQDDDGALATAVGFTPAVGVSYDLRTIERPEPEYIDPLRDVPPPEPAGDESVAEEAAPVTGPRRADGAVRDTVLASTEEMVLLPDGTFVMGLTDEDPLALQTAGLKRVTVSKFFIDRHEVTNAEYRSFLDELDGTQRQAMMPDSLVWERAGNRIGWSQYFRGDAFADHPILAVTHQQAQAYCEAQDERLPTEAEWEYAARSGRIGGVYPWPGLEARDEAGRYLANYNPGRGGYAADGYAFTAPVDAFEPSDWGLYNMAGNVAEWVQDAYTSSYTNISDFNPLHENDDENRRVVRGGSWSSDAFYIGVGVRDAQPVDEASPTVGFRCAKDLGSETSVR